MDKSPQGNKRKAEGLLAGCGMVDGFTSKIRKTRHRKSGLYNSSFFLIRSSREDTRRCTSSPPSAAGFCHTALTTEAACRNNGIVLQVVAAILLFRYPMFLRSTAGQAAPELFVFFHEQGIGGFPKKTISRQTHRYNNSYKAGIGKI